MTGPRSDGTGFQNSLAPGRAALDQMMLDRAYADEVRNNAAVIVFESN
jgi:hypothetical protein